jgi:hypothetical protein
MFKRDVEDVLPDKPSELIRVALADLEKVERDERFSIDMDETYHGHVYGVSGCVVCLAGAVIAQQLAPGHEDCYIQPSDFESGSLRRKLRALNSFRCGNVAAGLSHLRIDRIDMFMRSVDICPYEDDSDRFKSDMLKLANILEISGL